MLTPMFHILTHLVTSFPFLSTPLLGSVHCRATYGATSRLHVCLAVWQLKGLVLNFGAGVVVHFICIKILKKITELNALS